MKIRRNILTISIYLQPYVTNQLIIKLDKFDCQFDDYLMDDPSIFKLHLTTENAWNTLFFSILVNIIYNIMLYLLLSILLNLLYQSVH
jgi:hypothetical protein